MSVADDMRVLTKAERERHRTDWEKQCDTVLADIKQAAEKGRDRYKLGFLWNSSMKPGQLDYLCAWLSARGFRVTVEPGYSMRGNTVIGHYLHITWGD